jgi:hypothetical protein
VLTAAAAFSATAAWPRISRADWRPTETVRVIVPAAAGGSTDVMGRFLAQHLQAAWGQSTVVENRSGAKPDYGTPAQFQSFVEGRNREIQGHHRQGRAADGGEVRITSPAKPLSFRFVDLLQLRIGRFDRTRQFENRLRQQLGGFLLVLRFCGA